MAAVAVTNVVNVALAWLGGIVTEKDEEGAPRHAFVAGSVAQANRVTGSELSVVGATVKVCAAALVLMTVVENVEVVPSGTLMPAGRLADTKLPLELPPMPGSIITFQETGTDDCCGSSGPVREAPALRVVTLFDGFAAMLCVAVAVFVGAAGTEVISGWAADFAVRARVKK